MKGDQFIEQIRTLVKQASSKDAELRNAFSRLSETLVEICKDVSIWGESGQITFWECEPTGEFEHGYLGFRSEDGIQVCHRDMYDCMAEADNPDPYGSHYKFRDFNEVPTEWLRRAVAAGKLEEVLAKIRTELQKHVADLSDASHSVQRLIDTPTQAIGSTFSNLAQELGYDSIVQDWRSAESSIASDPPTAIARACSLVETVCKHLLAELGVDEPADKSIHPLFKATARALGLDPEGQADSELKGLCGGLASVAQHIGSLRTKFSTAHGSGPDQTQLGPSHARLAVNAAGNLSTFFMEQWKAREAKKSN